MNDKRKREAEEKARALELRTEVLEKQLKEQKEKMQQLQMQALSNPSMIQV